MLKYSHKQTTLFQTRIAIHKTSHKVAAGGVSSQILMCFSTKIVEFGAFSVKFRCAKNIHASALWSATRTMSTIELCNITALFRDKTKQQNLIKTLNKHETLMRLSCPITLLHIWPIGHNREPQLFTKKQRPHYVWSKYGPHTVSIIMPLPQVYSPPDIHDIVSQSQWVKGFYHECTTLNW